ncbi:class II fructose-bisphosphatase [Candidatus Woesearchaeota archaeon]|nr:class II fructose-bisphosphatase [Candidatus Woesearchaeota archaeon]
MDKNLALEFVRITEAAAIASARWVGKGDKHKADDAATRMMRKTFNDINIEGKIVIGEGERDEAPMLFIGEKVGKGNGIKIDIAVDPLECTNSVAYGRSNAMAVLAAAPAGTLLHAPDIYMNKIAVGPKAKGVIDLDASVATNLKKIAKALEKEVKDLTVMVLERDRHDDLIKEIREADARIILIPDGDISAAIAPSIPYSGVDVLMGIGAAPEGVIAAAALSCLGGDFQGRLVYRNEQDKERTKSMGIKDLEKKMSIPDLVRTNLAMFAATGVTDGPFFKGVQFTSEGAITHSLVMRANTKTIRYITTHHIFESEPKY